MEPPNPWLAKDSGSHRRILDAMCQYFVLNSTSAKLINIMLINIPLKIYLMY